MSTVQQAYSRARAFLCIALAAAVVACTSNPLAVAQTPEQKYAAVKLTYDALLTPAQAFVSDTTIPADTRRAVQAAVAKSGDLYRSLNTAYVDYVAAKAQLAAGTTSADKLNIASANLANWEQQLEGAVGGLASLIAKH